MGISNGKCTSLARLDGKTAIVTGSNTGIGKCTVQDFFERGARVIMACRNLDRANEAATDIKKNCESKQNLGEIVVTQLDLSSLRSVRTCAKHILETEARIDLLINNAGIMMCPKMKTEDGFEMQFGTNHLGHFLLTLMLLPTIVNSTPARIINVSSMAHWRGKIDFNDLNSEKKGYSAIESYRQSKLTNVLFTKELERRIRDENIKNLTVYSLHPGVIATELGRHLDDTYPGAFYSVLRWVWDNCCKWAIKTPLEGAQTSIYCAVDEKCANETGLYYSDCAVKEPCEDAKNPEIAKRLWEESLKMVDLPENYNPFRT